MDGSSTPCLWTVNRLGTERVLGTPTQPEGVPPLSLPPALVRQPVSRGTDPAEEPAQRVRNHTSVSAAGRWASYSVRMNRDLSAGAIFPPDREGASSRRDIAHSVSSREVSRVQRREGALLSRVDAAGVGAGANARCASSQTYQSCRAT